MCVIANMFGNNNFCLFFVFKTFFFYLLGREKGGGWELLKYFLLEISEDVGCDVTADNLSKDSQK